MQIDSGKRISILPALRARNKDAKNISLWILRYCLRPANPNPPDSFLFKSGRRAKTKQRPTRSMSHISAVEVFHLLSKRDYPSLLPLLSLSTALTAQLYAWAVLPAVKYFFDITVLPSVDGRVVILEGTTSKMFHQSVKAITQNNFVLICSEPFPLLVPNTFPTQHIRAGGFPRCRVKHSGLYCSFRTPRMHSPTCWEWVERMTHLIISLYSHVCDVFLFLHHWTLTCIHLGNEEVTHCHPATICPSAWFVSRAAPCSAWSDDVQSGVTWGRVSGFPL